MERPRKRARCSGDAPARRRAVGFSGAVASLTFDPRLPTRRLLERAATTAPLRPAGCGEYYPASAAQAAAGARLEKRWPASDAGGALGQLGGPVLAAAPWAPIAATPELRRPPSGPLQVRAPQLAPCCVAHKLSNANANAPSPPRGVTGCAPLRACSQAIAAPGSRTVGCTGAPSQLSTPPWL